MAGAPHDGHVPATPLLRPTAFFEERPAPGLVEPTLVVLAAGMLLMGSTVLVVDLGVEGTPAQLAVGVALAGLVGGVAAWGFVSLVVFAVSALLGGEGGGLRETAAALGWGYLPMVVGGVVDVAAALLFSETTATVPDPLADPRSLVLAALGVGFILWQGYVWFAAVRHVRNLTSLQAALAVTIPVGLPLVVWLG